MYEAQADKLALDLAGKSADPQWVKRAADLINKLCNQAYCDGYDGGYYDCMDEER